MKRLVILDGDMLAYRNAAAIETPAFDWGDSQTPNACNPQIAKARMDRQIEDFMKVLKGDDYFVALSVPDEQCFRRKVLPSYKGNRVDKVRPAALGELKDYLLEKHRAVRRPELEADDIMGIKATDPKRDYEPIIVTIDKDLKQIPCFYYNPYPHSQEPVGVTIDEQFADWFFMYQVLIGDDIDGYKGCPGIGPKKATAILNEVPNAPLSVLWSAVVSAFKSKGLTEADALVQARASRILRHGEWTPTTGVKLWTP